MKVIINILYFSCLLTFYFYKNKTKEIVKKYHKTKKFLVLQNTFYKSVIFFYYRNILTKRMFNFLLISTNHYLSYPYLTSILGMFE